MLWEYLIMAAAVFVFFYLLLPWTVKRGKVWYKKRKEKQKGPSNPEEDDGDDGEFRREYKD